jgi:hypothetical protein
LSCPAPELIFRRGDAQGLETALSKGIVTWQGVVKNIDYLGLDDGIKRVIGKWWRRWVKVAVGRDGGVGLGIGGMAGPARSDDASDGESEDGGEADVEEDDDGSQMGKDDAERDEVAGLMGQL